MQAPRSLAEAGRQLLVADSVAPAEAAALLSAADVNGDGLVDLLELMRALYKWAPAASAAPNGSLAAARDAALDMFLLLGENPIRWGPLLALP
jgi:hypothetical protein